MDRLDAPPGPAMPRDAHARSMVVAKNAGVRAMLVHALDASAKAFYEHYSFRPSPWNPMALLRQLPAAKKYPTVEWRPHNAALIVEEFSMVLDQPNALRFVKHQRDFLLSIADLDERRGKTPVQIPRRHAGGTAPTESSLQTRGPPPSQDFSRNSADRAWACRPSPWARMEATLPRVWAPASET